MYPLPKRGILAKLIIKKHSNEEERWQTVGIIDKAVFVVFMERGEKIRIISARAANPREWRIYGNSNFNIEGWFKANA
jgi:uncharacterized DUF497 family protein